jgi:transcriptional regulator with XRE-family HTH domain
VLAPRRDILRSIAANVRELRLRRGLTQAELAERADVDLRLVQRVERAERDFAVSAFVKLGTALDVRLDALVRPATLHPARRGRPLDRGGSRT